MALLEARGRATALRPDRPPLWTVALTALLVGIGYQKRRPADRVGSHASGPSSAARTASGRGRSADSPSEIPVSGWKDILLRVYNRISRDRIMSIAAGVTFYALLAIFPAIAALVAIYGFFADPASISDQIDNLAGMLPSGAIDVIRGQATRVASQPAGTLSVAFIVGLLLSLWSANAGMKAVFDALNISYREEEKRSFIRLNAISLAFTLSLIAFALVAIGVVVVLPHIIGGIGLGNIGQWVVSVGKWPAMLVAVAIFIALLYRFGPSRDQPRWRWISWGSAFAAVVWLGASLLFSWYTANFGSYNKTYGSLGAVVGFMTWIWLSSIVILVGAMLDAEMEHQTTRDTTVGRPQPLGRRGATMADTVGN